MGLALGGVSYSVLATFVTLFYVHRHWSGAALCLTAFGVGFIVVRVFCIKSINRYGGFPVAIASLLTEAVGMILLWQAVAPWMAMAGAAVGGLGLSLIFPAIGVEAVKRVPEFNRGTALGVYTAFADVSFFLVGPIAGAIIGFFGYASVFLFALISVLAALGIVVVLKAGDAGPGTRDTHQPPSREADAACADAGAALAWRLGARGPLGFLPLRRRQRGIVRRLAWTLEIDNPSFEVGVASLQRSDPRQRRFQPPDQRQQRQDECILLRDGQLAEVDIGRHIPSELSRP